MSLLRWLFSRKPAGPADADSSNMSRVETTRPLTHGRTKAATAKGDAAHGAVSSRKTERMARREQLYVVVREAMVVAGILSAAYKFKVLSLDPHGHQFLVMMDLAAEFGGQPERLAEIEALVAQTAKARHDIVVTAVYWRTSDHVAVGRPGVETRPPPAAVPVVPAAPVPPRPAPAPVAAAARAQAAAPKGFDPLQDDEVQAFRQALASAAAPKPGVAGPAPVRAPSAPAATPPGDATNYTFLTGYEDTEMPEQDLSGPMLGATQYGELK